MGFNSRWSSFIQALNPILVYSHHGNIVVVQEYKNGIEYGNYLESGYSSSLSGGEGIILDGVPIGSATNHEGFSYVVFAYHKNPFRLEDFPPATIALKFDRLAGQPPLLDRTPVWGEEINAMRPLRVYRDDGGSIVVVQKISDGVEYGKYLYWLGSSSGLPDEHSGFSLDRRWVSWTKDKRGFNYLTYDYRTVPVGAPRPPWGLEFLGK